MFPKMPADIPVVTQALLLTVVITAGVFDLRTRRIPNWLSLSGVILGLASNFGCTGVHGVRLAVMGMFFALLVYLPLYLIRAMGAGDVKLMAAVGSIAGPENWFCIFIVTALVGGVVSLILVCAKRRLHHTLLNVSVLLSELAHGRVPGKTAPELDVHDAKALRLPHGSVIALGSLGFVVVIARS